MFLKTLSLRHFRNYQEQMVEFTAPKTILVGNNAQGKSNLLEAVELLATLRSHRTSRDKDLVKDEESIATVSGSLKREFGVGYFVSSTRTCIRSYFAAISKGITTA